MGDELKDSGIFQIAMTNNSGSQVKITRNTNIGLLKSCAEDKICTIHKVGTFHKKEEPRPEIVEKNMYAIPIKNKSGKIESNTVLVKKDPECLVISELGSQEGFVKYEKPKLQDAPVNAKVVKDLRNYMKRILVLLQKLRYKLILHLSLKCLLIQVTTNLLQSTLTHYHLNIMTGWRKKLTKCAKLVWSGKVIQAKSDPVIIVP